MTMFKQRLKQLGMLGYGDINNSLFFFFLRPLSHRGGEIIGYEWLLC